MKTKLLSVFLLTVILSIVAVSANLITLSQGPTLSQSQNQTYVTITALSDSSITMINSPITISDGNNNYMTLTFNPSTINNQFLSAGSTIRVNGLLTIDPNFNFHIQSYTFPSLSITASQNQFNNITNTVTLVQDNQSVSFSFLKTFCNSGENGTALSISETKIKNNNGDDLDWKPLDNIRIDVKVENNGNDNVRKVKVELGLIDPNGRNIVNNLQLLDNKKIDLGTINSGNDKTASYTFQVPVDFKDQNYNLVVKAYSDDLGQTNMCTSSSSDLSKTYYEVVSGTREDRSTYQVIVDNLQLASSTVQCGERAQLSGEVYNIGDTDYTDQVKVNLYNKELGINQDQIIRTDLNQGDSASTDFAFDVPINATEKTYILELRTYYDYNSRTDSYSTTSANRFTQSLVVQGNCQATTPSASSIKITADLDSQTPDATPGKDLILDSTITNLGSTTANLDLSVLGNSAWSTLVSISPQSISLAPGQSKIVTIKLNIDQDATGDQNLKIRASSLDKTFEQTVNISLAAASVQSNAFIENIKANWFIYLIILVNVILIIAIILVIRRMLVSR